VAAIGLDLFIAAMLGRANDRTLGVRGPVSKSGEDGVSIERGCCGGKNEMNEINRKPSLGVRLSWGALATLSATAAIGIDLSGWGPPTGSTSFIAFGALLAGYRLAKDADVENSRTALASDENELHSPPDQTAPAGEAASTSRISAEPPFATAVVERTDFETLVTTFDGYPLYVDILNRQLRLISDTSSEAAEALLSDLSAVDRRLETLLELIRQRQGHSEHCINEALCDIEQSLSAYKALLDDFGARERTRERSEAESAERFRRKIADETKDLLGSLHDVRRIAKQTTMLSFNVSIEAARAGELGPGFSIIGMEIRTLAEEVQQLANDLQARVNALMTSISDSLLTQSEAREKHHREAMERIASFLDGLSGNLARVLQQQVRGYHADLIKQMANENERLAEPIMAMMGSIQFQDIVRQQVEQLVEMSSAVGTHIGTLRSRLDESGLTPPGGRSLADLLDGLSSDYVTEEQRNVHRLASRGRAVVDVAPRIELF
jgi:methyl-accepting chemotaxis protein